MSLPNRAFAIAVCLRRNSGGRSADRECPLRPWPVHSPIMRDDGAAARQLVAGPRRVIANHTEHIAAGLALPRVGASRHCTAVQWTTVPRQAPVPAVLCAYRAAGAGLAGHRLASRQQRCQAGAVFPSSASTAWPMSASAIRRSPTSMAWTPASCSRSTSWRW